MLCRRGCGCAAGALLKCFALLPQLRGQNLLGFALMEVRDELRRVTQNEMLCDWSMVWQQ